MYIPIGMSELKLKIEDNQDITDFLNSDGVLPVSFLKELLNAVFELFPTKDACKHKNR